MTALKLFAVCSLLLCSTQIWAADYLSGERKLGLGVIIGEPTGVSGKLWMKRDWAIDTAVSYSFFSYLHIMANSVWHFHEAIKSIHPSLTDLSAYLGAGSGVRISSKDKPKSGDARANWYVRVPMGLEYLPRSPRIGPFIEFAPGIGLAPKVFPEIHGGIGIRYYF